MVIINVDLAVDNLSSAVVRAEDSETSNLEIDGSSPSQVIEFIEVLSSARQFWLFNYA